MMIDLTLRAQTPATLAYALKRPMFLHLGIQFPVDEFNVEILNPDNWIQDGSFGPDIFYHYIRQDDLVVSRSPVKTDSYCWILMRLTRDSASSDFENDPTNDTDPQPDMWRKSRAKNRLKEIGQQVDWKGIRTWQHTFPRSPPVPGPVRGKSIQILRGLQLATLNIFPEFDGGGHF